MILVCSVRDIRNRILLVKEYWGNKCLSKEVERADWRQEFDSLYKNGGHTKIQMILCYVLTKLSN